MELKDRLVSLRGDETQEDTAEKLGLELNKKTQIFKSKQGVNFCRI